MQTKIEFVFGVGEDSAGMPLSKEVVTIGLMQIRKRAAELFGGCTMYPATGGWTNPEGRLVEEPGYILFVIVASPRKAPILAMVDCIKGDLRQHSVVVSMTQTDTRII